MIFLLDATFPPKLAHALQELTERRDCEFRYANDEFGEGAQDEVLIDGARDQGWFLMTMDERITRNPAKRRAVMEGASARSSSQVPAFRGGASTRSLRS